MNTKVCAKCGKEKPIDQFHKRKSSKDGHRSYCKDCENNVEQTVIKTSKVCSKCKQEKTIDQFFTSKQSKDGHRSDCKDCKKISDNKSYITHKSKRLAYGQEYQQTHQFEIAEYKHQLYIDNYEQIRLTQAILSR